MPRAFEKSRRMMLGKAAALCACILCWRTGRASEFSRTSSNNPQLPFMSKNRDPGSTLSATQRSIVPIAAFAASGNISKLNGALIEGLDEGLSINEIKEILIQLYAYAGFPRSLNALGAFMTVLEARNANGMKDKSGPTPQKRIPQGEALLEEGTRNQTSLVGAPVQGPLFEFAPAIDTFLKTHLFGDIFCRDNLDWHAREVATISMLSALDGVASQLQSHLKVAMNIGFSTSQLEDLIEVLSERVGIEASSRALEALTRLLNSKSV